MQQTRSPSRCWRCGKAQSGRLHLHLPWSGNPADWGCRFYCNLCWRKICCGAMGVMILGGIAIGGLAGLIFLITSWV